MTIDILSPRPLFPMPDDKDEFVEKQKAPRDVEHSDMYESKQIIEEAGKAGQPAVNN